ncbi:MAG: chromosomal replication initiator protein DnaA [Candidatus Pacebacteria bacterium CG_4_10_14_0_8_um_filter_43_12]|nr:MAG: chromosomal replication initiator protein DnaA [Candidatus Pacebacteria bacterium CG10_big_fil_rev_8_21_14_0_10_44_11]PIY79462.1 MAG: chromosomal replication initiator protein DnaA [Candidatus Pacebacteria bacterium CG_4_10_14_0_8_um_filter_43_12]
MDGQSFSTTQITSLWKQYCVYIQQQLSPAVYNTWILSNPITQIELVGVDKARVTITSPTAFHSTNLNKNLHLQIKQVLDSILDRSCDIQYRVGNPVFGQHDDFEQPISAPTSVPRQTQPSYRYSHQSSSAFTNSFSANSDQSPRVEDLFSQERLSEAAQDRLEAQARGIGLRSDYTFSTFAVSTTNEMAHAAATAVSNRPGLSYNPLFLYGGVGVGKTHLMQAIGNNILKNNPLVKILYCTGEEFTNEIVNAIQTKKARNFKEKYRTVDILLIDDIQFIAGKNAVQEEFFHTFNALTKVNHQIVLTSDRPPHEITLLEDRLRSRFEAGLMIDIQQPSFELRTAILLVKSKAQNLPISIEMAKTIAARVDSARKIEGIITSIRSEIELKKKELSPELIDEILQLEIETKRPRIKVAPGDIIKTVANHYHIKQSSLKGHSRIKSLVTARHVCMFLLKKELSLPLTEIGRWFAGRDHTSVLHAVNKVEREMNIDDLLQQDISALRTTLTAISH